MINKNTKAFRDKVRAYVLDYVRRELEASGEKSDDRPIHRMFEIFRSEYSFEIEHSRNRTMEMLFRQWANSRPMFEYRTWYQRQTLKDWYEQTEEESCRYPDQTVDNTYYYLCVREFFNLLHAEE